MTMRAAILFTTLIVWTWSACLPAYTNARQAGDMTTTRCDARAYMIDHDPGGTNVRSGPGKTFKIIGNLPTQGVEGIAVHLTGSSGDWVRIDSAVEEGGEQERIFFPSAPVTGATAETQAQGWIHTTLLGATGMAVTKGGTNLYRQPLTNSRVVIRIPGGDDSLFVRGCRGGWMYIEYKKLKGWAAPDTLCANSLTTCV
jgi:uncharacterized protein YraI